MEGNRSGIGFASCSLNSPFGEAIHTDKLSEDTPESETIHKQKYGVGVLVSDSEIVWLL